MSSSVFLYPDSPTSPAPEGFPQSGLHIEDNPWIKVAAVFQKHVLSWYADELVTNFEALGNDIHKTTFKTFASYSSWNNQPYAINGHTISANGAAPIAANGSAIAGVFTTFNNVALSTGDHYIAMVRDSNSIRFFHPKGAATPITITLPSEFKTYTLKSYSLGDAPLGSRGLRLPRGTYFIKVETKAGLRARYHRGGPLSNKGRVFAGRIRILAHRVSALMLLPAY